MLCLYLFYFGYIVKHFTVDILFSWESKKIYFTEKILLRNATFSMITIFLPKASNLICLTYLRKIKSYRLNVGNVLVVKVKILNVDLLFRFLKF